MQWQAATTVYAARWIVPITRPPIHHGWIRLQQGRIAELAAGAAPAGAMDLGDVAILPGWVNAHTHLEFSDLASPIPAPATADGGARSLPAWIASVVRHRAASTAPSAADRSQQRRTAIARGLEESAIAGVRLLAEVATQPWPLVDVVPRRLGLVARPDIVALGEVLGLSEVRQQETLTAAMGLSRHVTDGVAVGLSPHAPYSTTPALVDAAVEICRQRDWPLAMHVAESRDELELLAHGSGAFRAALESIGAWRDGLFPRTGGVAALLRQLAAAPRCLLIHGNYLSDAEIDYLATQPQMTVVYCPRTHAFFGHPLHPVAQLHRAGVRVALGTDSRASNPDLNPWEEVRYLLDHRSDLAPEQILRMATRNGALALGRNDCGCLQPGAAPGLLTVATGASNPQQLWASLGSTRPTPLVETYPG